MDVLRFVERSAAEFSDWDYLYRLYLRFWMPRGWRLVEQDSPGCYTYFLLRKGGMIAKFSSEEKGGQPDHYPEFAIWAARQNSPHLPKIYQARYLKRHGIFCCIMEKLYPFRSEELDDIIWRCPEHNPVPYPELFPSKTNWLAACVLRSARKQDLSYVIGSRVGSLVSTFERMLNAMGWPSDLHGGNVMYRTDGTVVITDPYAAFFIGTDTANRNFAAQSVIIPPCSCRICRAMRAH